MARNAYSAEQNDRPGAINVIDGGELYTLHHLLQFLVMDLSSGTWRFSASCGKRLPLCASITMKSRLRVVDF
jgi:hypothetical protein